MVQKKNLIENYEDGNLDLSLSGLLEVPVRDIAAIPKATCLDLSCNTIVTLPRTFATSLTRLVKLDLSQNQITSLPDNFGLLVNLKHLDLDNNKLESLPLSFGNLKFLRWLDLKRNPLMPKLAEIAGHCLDASQCQEAARNVVAALRAMQEQVNAEISRRKEEQIKKIEQDEENAKKKNKENQHSKKKKKKAGGAGGNNVNSTHINGQTHVVDEGGNTNSLNEGSSNVPSVPNGKTTQKPSLLKKVIHLLSSTVKVMVMSTLLVVFCGFLLSLIDEDMYIAVRAKLNEMIRTNVPKHYMTHWDNGLLLTRRALASWSSQLITISVHSLNKVQHYFIAISSDEVVQQYLGSINSGVHILWIWISELYASVCVELPRYFSSIKRVIYESSTNMT